LSVTRHLLAHFYVLISNTRSSLKASILAFIARQTWVVIDKKWTLVG